MKDVLEQEIGLTYGLINEKNNQLSRDDKDKLIQGNANMLMNQQ